MLALLFAVVAWCDLDRLDDGALQDPEDFIANGGWNFLDQEGGSEDEEGEDLEVHVLGAAQNFPSYVHGQAELASSLHMGCMALVPTGNSRSCQLFTRFAGFASGSEDVVVAVQDGDAEFEPESDAEEEEESEEGELLPSKRVVKLGV